MSPGHNAPDLQKAAKAEAPQPLRELVRLLARQAAREVLAGEPDNGPAATQETKSSEPT